LRHERDRTTLQEHAMTNEGGRTLTGATYGTLVIACLSGIFVG
jgi:hypothetical protein